MHQKTPLTDFNIKTSFAPMFEYGVFDGADEVPFESSTEFSIVDAWYMAECSRLAYGDDKDEVAEHLDKVNMPGFRSWSVEGTDVFASWDDTKVWLVSTGTELEEGMDDILVDLQSYPVSFQNGDALVHAGFQRALNYVLEDVLRFVNDLLDTRRELYITGHSLGGALSLEFATYFENQGTYVYGCPRTFSKGGRKLVKGPVHRVDELHDIVTRVPLPPVFRHLGDQHFITNDGHFLKNPNLWTRERHRLGNNELTIIWNLAKVFLLKGAGKALMTYLHGHSPYNYSVYCWNEIVRTRTDAK